MHAVYTSGVEQDMRTMTSETLSRTWRKMEGEVTKRKRNIPIGKTYFELKGALEVKLHSLKASQLQLLQQVEQLLEPHLLKGQNKNGNSL